MLLSIDQHIFGVALRWCSACCVASRASRVSRALHHVSRCHVLLSIDQHVCGAVQPRAGAAMGLFVSLLLVVILRVALRRALRVSRACYIGELDRRAGVPLAQECDIIILAEGAIALPVTLSGGVLFAS